MLDLEIIPHRAISHDTWEVVIGSPVGDVIQSLQAAVDKVKHVDFGYVECDPEQDYHITLPNDGIRFVFCAHSQRLKKIEIYDMKLCALRYGEIYFNSNTVSPTLSQIDASFGATHPGEYSSQLGEYVLTFRGLAFTFDSQGEPGPNSLVKKCIIFGEWPTMFRVLCSILSFRGHRLLWMRGTTGPNARHYPSRNC